MDHNFIRVAVTGATGRMGKELIRHCITTKKLSQCTQKIVLGAVLVRSNSDICGIDAGKLINMDAVGVIVSDNLEKVKNDFDILIDFTNPESTMEYLKFCVKFKKNMVIGTTGLDLIQKQLVKDASKKIGIVYSANFSVGITVMLSLLRKTTQILGNVLDVDIVDMHHTYKKDIPSGTALMMHNVIKKTMLESSISDNNQEKIFDLDQKLCGSIKKSFHNIKIHSIRSGDIVGEHTVLFSGIGERLEITHKASNRIIFVNGALRAAIWLEAPKIGLFDLYDVLDLNLFF